MNRRLGLIALAVVVILSCNKNPLGEDELADRGVSNPLFLSVSVDSLETSYTAPAQGTSLNLILGRDQEYESRVLLNFSYPDTISTDMHDIRLTMYKRKVARDDTFEFNIHVVTTGWSEDGATWALADQGSQWYRKGGDYESSVLVSKIAAGDSIVIPFTREQLITMQGGQGIILIPTQDGLTTFYSREGNKPVRLTYKKGDDRYDMPLSGDAHIINDSLPEPYRKLWLGSGIPFRPFLHFSAADTVLEGKKIIYGILRLKRGFARSQRDTVDITINALTEPYRGFDTKFTSALVSTKFSLQDSIYDIDVIRLIQRIAYRADSNYGFFIMTSPENYDISRFEFKTDSIAVEVGYITPPRVR